MKIKRHELIELVQGEITRIEAEDSLKAREDAARKAKSKQEYIERTGPHWDEFARRILDAVIDEKPVVRAMVPGPIRGHYSDGLRFWDSERGATPAPQDRAKDLRVLLRFLNVTIDEEINTTALERQGFPLGRVLRGAI